MVTATKVEIIDNVLAFKLILMSTIVWNMEIPVIAGIIGWVGLSRMQSIDGVGILVDNGCVCDIIIVINIFTF